MADASKYSSERVFLVPYTPSQQPFESAEGELQDLLSYLYQRTRDDGFLGLVFTGMKPPSRNKFIWMLYSKPIVVAFLKPKDGELPEAIGFGWLMEVEGEPGSRKANFGFSFFRNFHGTEAIREAAVMALRWWFEELRCDILFGPTLKRNLLAQRFAQELGFDRIAEIPKFFSGERGLEPAVLVAMDREKFDRLYGSADDQELANAEPTATEV